MTTIFAGTKQHDDAPHAETIEIDETTGTLFHTIVHQDGTVAHEMVRVVTPDQMEQYLSHIPHWQDKGFGSVDYTDEQHATRLRVHAKHSRFINQLPETTTCSKYRMETTPSQ